MHKLDKEREKFPEFPSTTTPSIITTEIEDKTTVADVSNNKTADVSNNKAADVSNDKTADVSTLGTPNHNTNESKSSEDREQETKNKWVGVSVTHSVDGCSHCSAKEEALLNEEQSGEQSNHSPVVSSSENSPTGSPSTPRNVLIGKIAPGAKTPPKAGQWLVNH